MHTTPMPITGIHIEPVGNRPRAKISIVIGLKRP